MGNLDIYNIAKEVPDNAKKSIDGGRMKGFTDINPMWRIKKLTELFGCCGIGWYYKPVKKWMETSGNETAAFVDIELFIKVNDVWSMPICGTGGSMFISSQKNGRFLSDECFKMATTDAISVACKQIGIGADVYWDRDTTKYYESELIELRNRLCKERERCGYAESAILRKYNVQSINDMTKEDIIRALDGFSTLPDRKDRQ